MLTRKIPLPTVINPNPTSGKTSVVKVPGGERVLQVQLAITADAGTNLPSGNWIGDIRVLLGGKVQRLHSMAELIKINKVNGDTYDAATLGTSSSNYGQLVTIFFAEPWRNDNAQGDFLAVETSKDKLLEIEIDCNGTPAGTTPTISITANAVVDGGTQPRNRGEPFVMSKIYRSDHPSAANLDITTLDKRDVYQALYITATNISKAILKANGLPIHELTKAHNAALLKAMQMQTQFDYDMVLDQDDALQNGLYAGSLSDLQLRIEQSSAAAIRVLSQRIGAPD